MAVEGGRSVLTGVVGDWWCQAKSSKTNGGGSCQRYGRAIDGAVQWVIGSARAVSGRCWRGRWVKDAARRRRVKMVCARR